MEHIEYQNSQTKHYSRRRFVKALAGAALALPLSTLALDPSDAFAAPARKRPKPKPTPTPSPTPSPVAPAPSPTLSPSISVLAFGAIGNGVADDTLAIQQAINAAAGRVVTLPAGAYRVTGTLWISAPVTLRGDGMNATTLAPAGGMTVIDIRNTSGVAIENLSVAGAAGATWGYGVLMAGVQDVAVRNCRFSQLVDSAVSLWGADRVAVTGCQFTDLRVSGVRMEAGINRNVNIAGNTFTRVCLNRIGGHGAVACGYSADPAVQHEYITIENNVAQSEGIGLALDKINYGVVRYNRLTGANVHGEGIAFSGSNNLIQGNQINGFVASGILLWAMATHANDQNLIDGNTSYDNANGIAAVAAAGNPSITNLTIQNNRCFDSAGGATQQRGVHWYIDPVWGGTTYTASNIVVKNNDLRGNAVAPYAFDGGVKPVLEGNLV